jgi:tetratricopeptide (TPR) repeat protein
MLYKGMRLNLSLPVLLILGAAASASAQSAGICDVPEKYIVTGRIIAPGVKWDSYVEVLQLEESRLAGYGYTNSTGEYTLPEQLPGLYYIVARIDGFKEARERIQVDGCSKLVSHFIYMEPEDEPIRPLVLDFTGEVKEVVDVAELKRQLPKNVVEEFERARQERHRGEQDEARRRLEKLLIRQPDFYDAHNALGSIYLELKRFRDAENQYNQARELRPNSAAPLVSLGALYVQEAEASIHPEPGIAGTIVPGEDLGVILDDARSILESAIRMKPDASFAYYLLGIAQTRGGTYRRAEETLRKALDLEGQLRWARIALANIYIKQHRWSEALAEFDIYLQQFKKVSNRGEVEEARKKVAAQLASVSK